MIELGGNAVNYTIMMVVATVIGGFGGIGAELLQDWMGNTGTIEKPRPLDKDRYDLGWTASVLLGAMAAVAILYFLPPQVETTVQTDSGEVVTTISYELVKLVALSLIAGSAGSVILRALVDRLQALLERQRAQTRAAVTLGMMETIERGAQADLEDAVRTALTRHRAAIHPELQRVRSKASVSAGGSNSQPGFDQEDQTLARSFDQALTNFGSDVSGDFAQRLRVRVEDARAVLNTIDTPLPKDRSQSG